MPASWPAGATAPALRFVWTEDGEPVDLTGWTVKLRFGPRGGPLTWERTCGHDSDNPAAQGKGYYTWQTDDLKYSGEYAGQLAATKGEETRLSEVFPIDVTRSL